MSSGDVLQTQMCKPGRVKQKKERKEQKNTRAAPFPPPKAQVNTHTHTYIYIYIFHRRAARAPVRQKLNAYAWNSLNSKLSCRRSRRFGRDVFIFSTESALTLENPRSHSWRVKNPILQWREEEAESAKALIQQRNARVSCIHLPCSHRVTSRRS